jgi:RNA polymerase sigma factor (sigma-70 family)
VKRSRNQAPSGGNAGFAVSAISLYAKELRRFLVRRVRKAWEVDDLAQEVYLRMLKTDPDSVRKPLQFMIGIAHHVLTDRLRATAREEQAFSSNWDTVERLREEPSEALEDKLEECLGVRQELLEALSRISPVHAAALVLFHRDGLTYEEVARKLGLSVDTVHTYMRDARRQIRMTHWAEQEGPGP